MSENILVDGKPLHLLRVVDLREELKKRGIKASGTKSHLQELLITAIQSAKEANDSIDSNAVEDNKADKDVISNEDNSNESSDNNSEPEPKVASVSINEEKETIKLTIRSSPRKSEPPPEPEKTADSETESSQSESESSSSPETEKDENVDRNESEQNKVDNEIVSEPVAIESANEKIKEMSVDAIQNDEDTAPEPVNHNNQHNDNEKAQEKNVLTLNFEKQIDKSPIKSKYDDLKPEEASDFKTDDKPKAVNEPLENDSNCSSMEPPSQSTTSKNVASKKRETPEPLPIEQAPPTRRRLLSQSKSILDVNTPKVGESEPESKSSKTSIRGRLLSHSKSVNEEDASSKPVQKKRRWGSSHTGESTLLKKGISSDELKQLINESVVESSESSAKVSKANAEESDFVQPTNDLTNNEPETKEEVKKVDVEFKQNTESNSIVVKKSAAKEDQIETEPKEPEIVTQAVSPAKNPESTVLFVTGLVRPYTLPQLKKLLSVNGSIDEEKFWIDKIKSKCYVVYTNTEEAVKTRASLHNLKWPQSSPKNLSVEFATLEDIDRCLHPENYEDLPQKTSPVKPVDENKNVNNIKKKKNEKDSVIEISKGKYDIILNEPAVRDGKAQTKNPTKDDASSRNIREWDRNKVTISSRKAENEEPEVRKRVRHSSEREREPPVQDKKERIRERSKTPEKNKRNEEAETPATIPREQHLAHKKSESPAKMLEDLFRKTKATPYIYWLPLSEEQALERVKFREVAEKERLARIAARRETENNKRENNSNPTQNRPGPNFPRDRPKFQNMRRRSPSPPLRRKRSISPSPRRPARYSRSRSPDRRRFSPRRRR